MRLDEYIREGVEEYKNKFNVNDAKAFAYWYLIEVEDFSEDLAEDTICDGPWDAGRDAIYYDEDERIYSIYQFKYSSNISYVEHALRDIQQAITRELNNIRNNRVKKIRCVIVSLVENTTELESKKKKKEKYIKDYLSANSVNMDDISIEIIGKKYLSQLLDVIYGIKEIELSFNNYNIINDTVVGLLNAKELKDYVNYEELFAFNIRKFLQMRRGSVNYRIRESLEDADKRKIFWVLNNGIVCLCTGFEIVEENKIKFKNFTIVNGAQTINTIAHFLYDNPTVVDDIWVLAKIKKVKKTDTEVAKLITMSSNTQTPTSNKDLRAVEPHHKWIKNWLDKQFGVNYIYRRGDRKVSGKLNVDKDKMAQSYIAFIGEPHISFSRSGQIFSNDVLYAKVYPQDDLKDMRDAGDQDRIKEYLLDRLIPYCLYIEIREKIKEKFKDESKRKFRSLATHVLWIYSLLLENYIINLEYKEKIFNNYKRILAASFDYIIKGLEDFISIRGLEPDIPRILKSTEFKDKLLQSNILNLSRIQEAAKAIENTISSLP